MSATPPQHVHRAAGERTDQRSVNLAGPVPSQPSPSHHHHTLHHPPHPTDPTTTPSPSSSTHSLAHLRQTPLHRGCAEWASPVEANVS